MTETETSDCGCTGDTQRAADDPAYRRAVWIVVGLNLGLGVIEAFGGFLADSQALKADALDFIGDGSITLIGILALAWSGRTRARVALAQGLFLGALGLGVIGFAVWRSLTAVAPEAGLMGGVAVAALVVNIAAALVLMRFRDGDAHVSAIWLFSRNDAIANVGVIIAAALVAWTGQAWPDLMVAAIIALIFLHSAYLIVRRAVDELNAQHGADAGVPLS